MRVQVDIKAGYLLCANDDFNGLKLMMTHSVSEAHQANPSAGCKNDMMNEFIVLNHFKPQRTPTETAKQIRLNFNKPTDSEANCMDTPVHIYLKHDAAGTHVLAAA